MTQHITSTSSFSPIFKKKTALSSVDTAWSAIFLVVSSSVLNQSIAQTTSPESTLKPIIISAPAQRQQVSIGGFDAPLAEQPLSATVITSEDIKTVGAQRLADLYKLDSSVSDAYNAVGYIDYATVRGYVIDNKFNIRRDGLPISGDTAINLANKHAVEILKGTSGIQAGTSAPGGLVNYVIKRPTNKPVRNIDLNVDSNGQFGAAVDLGSRFGAGDAQGYRLNFSANQLNSAASGTRGSKGLVALAFDSRISRDSFLEAEIEWSRQSQPNVPGLSLIGQPGLALLRSKAFNTQRVVIVAPPSSDLLPPADPYLNLNRQAWSQPTVFEGLTGSLRYTQALSDAWQWSAHLGSQRLKTDDRIAFPYGCDAEGIYDRFCSDGRADIYDFRSEGERRNKLAAQFKIEGTAQTGSVSHSLSFGALQTASRIQTRPSAYNASGSVNLADPTQPIDANPTPNIPGNIVREKTTEFFATDVIAWNDRFKTWVGLRHTRLSRSDALNAPPYSTSFDTPWLALSYQAGAHTLYASHGQSIESRVVPNLPAYGATGGLPLAAQRSRQNELGIKSLWMHEKSQTETGLTLFDIKKPLAIDTGTSLTFDGQQRHRGLEVSATHSQGKGAGAWQLGASATFLRATQENVQSNPALNALKPINVPNHILRLNGSYKITSDWLLGAHISHEGRRAILADNSTSLPVWTRLDASLKWDTAINGIKSAFQFSANNLLNKRFFQESPTQFGHVYLFPAQPRAWRIAASFEF